MFRRITVPVALLIAVAIASADEPQPMPSRVVVPKLPPGFDADKLSDPKKSAEFAEWLDKEYPTPQPESVRMLTCILRKGVQMSGQDGWFGPAETRYNWKWLTAHCGVEANAKAIPKAKFNGNTALFERLDRHGDGAITPNDLDWSDQNPMVMQLGLVSRLFRRLDANSDGKITREDLDAFFKLAAAGKDHVTPEDLRRVLIPRGGYLPGDMPSTTVLVRGFLAGEIGSFGEGPKVGESAPDFTLRSPDGKTSVRLSKLTGRKPVVLVFGNFTCGPFRALYPEVDALYQQYKDKAEFLMVYVREAHPTNGWAMESNVRAGVQIKQPTTLEERVAVCEQFRKKLSPGMTVVVDDITDPVNTAYSGVPSRLYVIDAKGKIAFKNGRGPFGFKPGEMEQALVMALMEASPEPGP